MSLARLSRRRFLSLSGAAMAHAAAGRSAPGCPPPPDPADLVAGNTAFGLDLYARLRKQPGNLFLSPFSISTALAMTSAGAKGTTLDEMAKVLHLPADPHPAFGDLLGRLTAAGKDIQRPYELTTANAIWAQQNYPWRPEFKELLGTNYGAGLLEADFKTMPEAARQRVNAWVEKETKQKIKDLIPAGVITPLTRMVLGNAVYFKGTWATQFKKQHTKDQPFRLADGREADVPLMAQTGTFGYGELDYSLEKQGDTRVQVLELPYAGGDLSMVILLPARGRLSELEASTSAFNLARWTKALRPQPVQVFLPRFKVEMTQPLSLKEPLRALGMKAAFDDATADFSGMHTGQEKLCVTAVLHKAFVDVNEEGTEAAAATGVVVGLRSAPARPKEFRADRPFLFLIRDTKTGSVLFLGRVTNPKA